MKVLSNHQHDMDWWDVRRGRVSGSMVSTVLYTLAKGAKKGLDSAERYRYKIKLVTEELYQTPMMGGFLSAAMVYGTENEPLARAAYEMATGLDVWESGFILHDTIDRFGGSPDGFVGDDGLIEIKVPESTTHMTWRDKDEVPEQHQDQMMAYMSITGRQWCDFVSFDPRAPSEWQLFTKRLLRNDERIEEIETGVLLFLGEVGATIERMWGKNPLKEQLRRSVQMEDMLVTADDIEWIKKQQMEALGR